MYEHITKFIEEIDQPGFDHAGAVDGPLTDALCDPSIADKRYRETLDASGLEGPRARHANVEALDLKATVALLTWLHRADYFDGNTMLRSLENGYVCRILMRLRELDGGPARRNVVTFFGEDEADGYLSNWYPAPFEFDGRTFATSEHWMMWQKARVFGDEKIAGQVLEATSPDVVKGLGRQVAGYSTEAWDAVNLQLMRVGLRQKFVQNERLLNALLGTGAAVLGEASPTDTKWGVGFGQDDPKVADPANWYGRSLLGITLMEVRADLRALCAKEGRLSWSARGLRESHVWRMSLLELARIPSTRPVALMYATVVSQDAPGTYVDARAVLRDMRTSVGDIDAAMRAGKGELPAVGWYELIDELALQQRLGRL